MSSPMSSQNSDMGFGNLLPLQQEMGSLCPCEHPTDLNLAKHLLFDHVVSPSLTVISSVFMSINANYSMPYTS